MQQPAPTDNRSSTIRINYDQTIKPTLLLHLGVGYLYTYVPSGAPNYDETSLGLNGISRLELISRISPVCLISLRVA